MISPRIVIIAGVTAALVGCSADPTGNPTKHTPPPLAYVRYYNAVGDTLPLDFRPIDQLAYSTPFLATPFRAQGLGGYQGYAPGPRHIRVFPNSTDLATTTSVVFDTTITLTAGTYYTFTHIGYARAGASPKISMWVTEDQFPSVASGSIAIRAVNVGPDVGNVDVYITSAAADPLPATPAFANVGFKTATAYVQRGTGALFISVYAAGNRTTPLIAPTALAAGSAGDDYFQPIGGSGQSGTVATAMIYSRATAGSSAAITAGAAANTTPRIYYWIDKQPTKP